MSTSDKIGLLPGFGWIVDHPWLPSHLAKFNLLVTLLLCLLIAPIGVWLVQIVFEWTVPSLKPEDNYKSFLYGDPMLALMLAIVLHLSAKRLPAEPRIYNSVAWHASWLVLMLTVALVLTWIDYRSGQFTLSELLSASKLYHNIVLYGLYGYVIVVTLIAYVWGNAWRDFDIWSVMGFAAAVCWGIWWGVLVAQDSSLSKAIAPAPAPAVVQPQQTQ
jgi:hypothetical protein